MATTRTHKSAAPAKPAKPAKVAQATPATLATSTAAAALPKEEGAAPVVSPTPEVAALAASLEPAAPAAPAVRAAQPQATDARRQYLVGTVPIRHNGRVYGIGYDIELTDTEAQRLAGLVALVR